MFWCLIAREEGQLCVMSLLHHPCSAEQGRHGCRLLQLLHAIEALANDPECLVVGCMGTCVSWPVAILSHCNAKHAQAVEYRCTKPFYFIWWQQVSLIHHGFGRRCHPFWCLGHLAWGHLKVRTQTMALHTLQSGSHDASPDL